MLASAVRKLRFKLPVFEGPLDLLLHLIRENKIDIYDIPIAEITRQYLDYLALWEALDLTVAGEYVVMAATLLEIKSRMLLPKPPVLDPEEEGDPCAELVQRLLEYQRYQTTVEALRGWEEQRQRLFFRAAQENPDDYLLPVEEGAMNASALLAALRRVLAEAEMEDEPIFVLRPRRRMGLRMKMAEILRKLRAQAEGLSFDALFERPLNRYDMVLTFLALLELLRQGKARAEQTEPLGEIVLYPCSPEPTLAV